MPNTEELLDQFLTSEPTLRFFCKALHSLIEEMLRIDGIRVHSVTARVKKREKLRQKLQRPNKNYETLAQITDQIGIRIITYYEDEVDQVASTLRREFLIDEKNSIDKRLQDDPEKFTYSSLHFVCLLSQLRAS